MIQPKKPSATESSLPFEIGPEPLEETLTARGGVSAAVLAGQRAVPAAAPVAPAPQAENSCRGCAQCAAGWRQSGSRSPSHSSRCHSRRLTAAAFVGRVTHKHVAHLVTSISSSQATRHCAIRSTMGRSTCPSLARKLASCCSFPFPCLPIVW